MPNEWEGKALLKEDVVSFQFWYKGNEVTLLSQAWSQHGAGRPLSKENLSQSNHLKEICNLSKIFSRDETDCYAPSINTYFALIKIPFSVK